MGQVTSTNSAYQSPVYVTKGLTITKILIQPHKRENRRIIKVDLDTMNLVLPKTKPLATFTQNERSTEHPFLLNCLSSDTITVSFKVNPDVLSDFDKIESDSFTIYPNLVLKIFDSEYNAIKYASLASKLIMTTSDEKTTMDPSVIVITKNKDEFKTTLSLNGLLRYGKTYITLMGGKEEIFKTMVYIEKDDTVADSSLENATYKDALFPFPPDGAEFRELLANLEERSTKLRQLLKTSIKKAQALDEATRHLALVRSGFSSTLSEIASYSRDIENPLMFDIINDLIPVMTEKSTLDIEESNALTRNIITPLTLIYNSDIKLLSNKRRLFYDQTKEFYSSASKEYYTDYDMLKSQVSFELNRYDYFQYLNEFRNGHSVRNLLYNFSLYLESYDKKLFAPNANENISKSHFYYQNFFKYKGAQQRMRNALATTTDPKDLPSIGNSPFPQASASSPAYSTATNSRPKTPDSSVDFSTMSADNTGTLSKSGILMTLGGKNKSGWHKQQVVISDNILSEYIDWRENHEVLRNNPVDLTFSCIKTVDTLRDRKYCIEVITPSNVKRLFQAESEVERESWVQALTAAASLKAKENQYNRPRSVSSDSFRTKRSSMRVEHLSAHQEHDPDVDNLSIVRDVDVSNQLCCDCGSLEQVEWISLNLLVVVCIDCSGVHRSLGSHVSKIRSLTLDTKSFRSKEMNTLLYHVSNKFANSYYQGALSHNEKLSPKASDQERREYITNKYVKKMFLLEEPSFHANESLIKGVHSANVPLVLKALAYGANVKMVVIKDVRGEKKEISLFEYSLTHCHGTPSEPIFDVSLLLYLNNAPCGDKVAPVLELNDFQKKFWGTKISSPVNSPATSAEKSATLEKTEPKNILRSHSMLLRKGSTIQKATPATDDHQPASVEKKDRTNRVSRFKMLAQPFKSNA